MTRNRWLLAILAPLAVLALVGATTYTQQGTAGGGAVRENCTTGTESAPTSATAGINLGVGINSIQVTIESNSVAYIDGGWEVFDDAGGLADSGSVSLDGAVNAVTACTLLGYIYEPEAAAGSGAWRRAPDLDMAVPAVTSQVLGTISVATGSLGRLALVPSGCGVAVRIYLAANRGPKLVASVNQAQPVVLSGSTTGTLPLGDGGMGPRPELRRWSQTCGNTVAGPIATDGGTAVLSLGTPGAKARRTWSSGYACCNCTEGTNGAAPAAITSCSGTANIAPAGSRIVPGVDYGWLPPVGSTTTPDAGPSDAQVCLCACEVGTCAITSCPEAP